MEAVMLLAHNALSFAIAYAIMSFVEYATHRWMLHTNTVDRLFPNAPYLYVKGPLKDHAVSRHSHFYKCFRREDDLFGKHVGLFIPPTFYLCIFVSIGLLLLLVDWISALYFVAFVVAHNLVWNKFHEVMHFYTKPWYLRVPLVGWWFRVVEYYHFLHHQHRDKNFNAFLPLCDWLLGTLAEETELDREVWNRVNAGEFVDRRGQLIVEMRHPAFLSGRGADYRRLRAEEILKRHIDGSNAERALSICDEASLKNKLKGPSS
jgi:hypothetical protein